MEDAVAEWTEPLPWGTAVFHKGVPWVREVNIVRVETTHGVRAGDIAFAAETRFPTQPAVEVLHEPIGATVAPAFAAAGWQVSRHLLMALEGTPPPVARRSRRSTPRWSGRCAPSGCAPSRGAPRRRSRRCSRGSAGAPS